MFPPTVSNSTPLAASRMHLVMSSMLISAIMCSAASKFSTIIIPKPASSLGVFLVSIFSNLNFVWCQFLSFFSGSLIDERQDWPLIRQILSAAVPCHRASRFPFHRDRNVVDDLPLLKVLFAHLPEVKTNVFCSCGLPFISKGVGKLEVMLRDPLHYVPLKRRFHLKTFRHISSTRSRDATCKWFLIRLHLDLSIHACSDARYAEHLLDVQDLLINFIQRLVILLQVLLSSPRVVSTLPGTLYFPKQPGPIWHLRGSVSTGPYSSSSSHLTVHRVRWRESGVSMTHIFCCVGEGRGAESALQQRPLVPLRFVPSRGFSRVGKKRKSSTRATGHECMRRGHVPDAFSTGLSNHCTCYFFTVLAAFPSCFAC